MKILFWNCRGLGNPKAVNALKRIAILENPQLIFLQETKLHMNELERIKNKLQFTGYLGVGCEGEGKKRSGGLAIFWTADWSVTLMSWSANHIDLEIISSDDKEWRFTGVYGHPEEHNKHKTCQLIKQLGVLSTKAWVCGGDWNLMRWSDEKQGGADFNFVLADLFNSAIDECGLMDLHYTSYKFTWNNCQSGDANLQERLDRILVNQAWKDMFGGSFVTHLEKRWSDHLPLTLDIKPVTNVQRERRKKKQFRFEEMWSREQECEDIILNAWHVGTDLSSNILRTSSKLVAWSKEKFGDFNKELKACMNQMKFLMEEPQTEEVLNHMRAVDMRMDELEQREEMYWRQRSRQDWLISGDKNTKFFHHKANQRRQRNHIEKIKDSADNLYEDEQEIMEVMTQYFEGLFTSNDKLEMKPVISKVQQMLTGEMIQPYIGEEVQTALNQMHPTKAPSPDGMCALFYQKYWAIVGPSVVEKVLGILNGTEDIGLINQTHLVLIPKKKMCESPVDFRPIVKSNSRDDGITRLSSLSTSPNGDYPQ